MKKKLTINIQNLSFKCIIGILDFERITKQKVIVNLSFDYIHQKDFFIDYSEVSSYIKRTMKRKKFKLIEDAIIYIETKLYNMYKINNLKIEIIKPTILPDCKVSISN